MSLIRKHTVTEKQLAANRRNQKLCHVPAALKPRKRIPRGQSRHEVQAKTEGVARCVLGEDPARFQELLEGLLGTYRPTNATEEVLVIRLARAMWLESYADGNPLRYAREVGTC